MLGRLIFFGFIALTCPQTEAGEYHTHYYWICSRCNAREGVNGGAYHYYPGRTNMMYYIMRNECPPKPAPRNCSEAKGDIKCNWVSRSERASVSVDTKDKYNEDKKTSDQKKFIKDWNDKWDKENKNK